MVHFAPAVKIAESAPVVARAGGRAESLSAGPQLRNRRQDLRHQLAPISASAKSLSEIDAKGHRLFRINGKNILIRGAGYTFDMLLRSSPERQEAELHYVRDMNLNAVRFEGKLEDDHFLELCDRIRHPGAGRLVLLRSLGEVGALGRRKTRPSPPSPCAISCAAWRATRRVFDWMYGSDNPPPPKIEQMYLDIIKEVEWPNPYQSSATAKKTPAGDTGREDDRARMNTSRRPTGCSTLSARRGARLQHRNQPRTRAAAHRKPAPHAARGSLSGPSIPGGTITPAAARSRTSTSSPRR